MRRTLRILRAWLWVPVLLPWLAFAYFWEWWHFGPSQRLLRAGDALDDWLDRRAARTPTEPEEGGEDA